MPRSATSAQGATPQKNKVSKDSPELSVVIPAFREQGRIEKSIPVIDGWLSGFPLDAEVKIIVEKSPDETVRVARQAVEECVNKGRFEVVDNEVQRGKGYAVRCGMLRSKGDIRMFMDADLSVPLGEIARAIDVFRGADAPDILIGTRYEGGRIVKRQGLVRRAGSRLYNLLLRGLGLTGVGDTQCGFKFFNSKACSIFEAANVDGFGFDIEILLLARSMGFSIGQLPVEWHNVGDSRFNPVRDGWRVLSDTIKVKVKLGRGSRKT